MRRGSSRRPHVFRGRLRWPRRCAVRGCAMRARPRLAELVRLSRAPGRARARREPGAARPGRAARAAGATRRASRARVLVAGRLRARALRAERSLGRRVAPACAPRVEASAAARCALSGGAVGWCMAKLVARHATPETDAAAHGAGFALDRARDAGTPREAGLERAGRVRERRDGDARHHAERGGCVALAVDATLRRARARRAHDRGLRTRAAFRELQFDSSPRTPGLPASDLEAFDESEREADAEASWKQQLAAWRSESEQRCEENFSARGPGGNGCICGWRGTRRASGGRSRA